VFQALHDHGQDVGKIVAFSPSTADAKKMLLSRNARYSGLIEKLEFAEGGDGELTAALGEATTWVAMNADGASLPSQLSAAAAGGVKRVFIHLSAASADDAPDTGALATACGSMEYTVMRTGALGKGGAGGGLVIGEIDQPVCDELPIDDAFRFIVESLTLPEASGRTFSLCPSVDGSQLKEMRMAGCGRREECVALLKGVIRQKTAEELEAEKETGAGGGDEAAAEADDGLSEEERAAKRDEELKMLMARAREKGIETQKRLAEEEEIKKKKRAERMAVFAQQPSEEEAAEADKKEKDDDDDDKNGGSDKPPASGGDGGKGGDGKGGGDGKKDDDDDGLALV